jgi:5-methylcytosine-specific restriction endonuclease McrA
MTGGRCLVLNADMSLIHVTPSWFAGVELVAKGKASPLACYNDVARSERAEYPVPAVVVLKRYVRVGRRRPSFSFPSKRNILIREGFKCAYCDRALTMGTVTKDHVHPVSRGGKDTLLNVVASCWDCNNVKADRTPSEAGMTLLRKPRELTDEEKLEVIVKTHKAHERAVWVTCLRENGLGLF